MFCCTQVSASFWPCCSSSLLQVAVIIPTVKESSSPNVSFCTPSLAVWLTSLLLPEPCALCCLLLNSLLPAHDSLPVPRVFFSAWFPTSLLPAPPPSFPPWCLLLYIYDEHISTSAVSPLAFCSLSCMPPAPPPHLACFPGSPLPVYLPYAGCFPILLLAPPFLVC